MKEHKHHTPDERYVLHLYERALQSGDTSNPFNKYEIGQHIGMHARGVDATCKLLVQANFIKKDGETHIYLTPHGESLAKTLLGE